MSALPRVVDQGRFLHDGHEEEPTPFTRNEVACAGEDKELGNAPVCLEVPLLVKDERAHEEEASEAAGLLDLVRASGDNATVSSEIQHYCFIL